MTWTSLRSGRGRWPSRVEGCVGGWGAKDKKNWQRVGSNRRPRAYEAGHPLRLLNKLSVTELSGLSKLSKSYISQVKHGNRPPSERLLEALVTHCRGTRTERDYLPLFLRSRRAMAVTPSTLSFYRSKLGRFLSEVNADKAQRQDIEAFLLSFENAGNRHAYYRAIKTFYTTSYPASFH